MSSPADRAESWPVSESEVVYGGPGPFSLRVDTLTAPSRPGESFDRLVLEHPGAVVVLAVDDEEQVLVLEQYRHPARRRFVELPAGLLDEDGEEPLAAARRELREEGLVLAEHWEHLLTAYTSPGISAERIEIYLATGLSAAPDRAGFEPEHEEADMGLAWVPMTQLWSAWRRGDVVDGPLGQALMAYRLRSLGAL